MNYYIAIDSASIGIDNPTTRNTLSYLYASWNYDLRLIRFLNYLNER